MNLLRAIKGGQNNKVNKHAGINVKKIRKAKKLSQVEFAKSLGYSQNMLSEIERGNRSVTSDLVGKLWEIYKVPPAFTLSGERPMFKDGDEKKSLITDLSKMETRIQVLEAQVKMLMGRLEG